MPPQYLFHYTDPESLEDILDEGWIRPTSSRKHAHHGTGVYLTTLGPNTDRQRLIFNNYRVENADRDRCPNLWDKTSAYIRIPMSHVLRVSRVDDPDNRIIYVNTKSIKIKGHFKTGHLDDDDDEHDY